MASVSIYASEDDKKAFAKGNGEEKKTIFRRTPIILLPAFVPFALAFLISVQNFLERPLSISFLSPYRHLIAPFPTLRPLPCSNGSNGISDRSPFNHQSSINANTVSALDFNSYESKM